MTAEARSAIGRAIASHWQLEALLLALAGIEICWFAPLLLAFTRSAWAYPPLLVGLVLWLLVWGMMRLARFMSERQIPSPAYELTVAGVVVLTSLLGIRCYVYRGLPLSDWSWLLLTARAFTNFADGIQDEVLIVASMLFLWWRSISLSQQDHTFQTVGYEFRRNVLLLILSTLLLSYLVGVEITAFIAPFFFFCLIGVALARVKDKSQVSGGIERPFGLGWLGILSVSSLLVLALGWLLESVYSVVAWRRLLIWLDPAFDWMGRAAGWLVVKLLELLGPLIEWLIRVVRGLLGSGTLQEMAESPLERLLQQLQEEAGQQANPPAWMSILFRYFCPVALVVGVLLVIAIWLDRRRRWRSPLVADESESLWQDGLLPAGSGNLLRNTWEKLRDLVGEIGRLGLGRRLYAALSVRLIYANVLRLAERRGYVRPVARTPSEFLPSLLRAFPGHEEDLARLTDAYVRVHYGELAVVSAELEDLRAAWNRLRRAPAASHGVEDGE
jgi:hypothetical protein